MTLWRSAHRTALDLAAARVRVLVLEKTDLGMPAREGRAWLDLAQRSGQCLCRAAQLLHPEILLHLHPRRPAQAGMLGWEVSIHNEQTQVLRSDQKGTKTSPPLSISNWASFYKIFIFQTSWEIGLRSFCIFLGRGPWDLQLFPLHNNK